VYHSLPFSCRKPRSQGLTTVVALKASPNNIDWSNTMRHVVLSFFVALGLLAGCTAQKPGGEIERTIQAEAKVIDINPQTRLVALEGKDGGVIVVEASDAVKNLDQVHVGDTVKIAYTEALAWQVKKSSEGAPGVTAGAEVQTAKPGEKPSGTAKRAVTITATISAIDLQNGTVTLTGPQGRSRTIKAVNPENLKKIKVGDLVDITYSEALAVSVQPVAKK